ncbi:conserved phage C-terminal domain-containing protein [uncultured Thomasclavelia sp.]|uniref:conserved phage C-terminal domain-containing protein n=1 Tax=uncultured Thomasclavelia sp. TaxID=3025759 RepID=UPI00259601E9|nr:conserved phage C-terminal domain-containing protein [uncultured Thomasclavelia sp.]
MKDNFLLKKAQQEVFDELSDIDAGKLIKGIYKYVNTGYSGLNGYLKVVFIPIKTEIDKNEERYEKVCLKNRENGKLGGRPKKTEKNPTVFSETEGKPKKPIRHNHIHNHNQLIENIIDYLNNKTNSKFKYTTKATQQKINARLNEGYVLDDFIVVIDKKYKEWVGSEFEKFLCPETLFGTKFEKYLNQKEIIKKEKSKVKEEKPKVKEEKPSWYGKNIEEETASAEEIKKLEDRINGV